MTRNLSMSRCGHLLLDGNINGYEVAEYIAKKVEVNPRMLSNGNVTRKKFDDRSH